MQSSLDNSIEVSVKGEWVRVPAVAVGENVVTVRGSWLKLAAVHDEEWLESEIDDPQAYVKGLKAAHPAKLRADIFTFTQKMPGEAPKHQYPMEWVSMAVIQLKTFKEWWEKLPQETRKNVRRAQKRGVTVRVHPFDSELLRGISDVNNESPLRQRVKNVYYGKTLEQVQRDYRAFADRSDFFVAYAGEEVIGFLKIVHRGEVSSILNLTTKASHSDKRPANALIAQAVEVCEARGTRCITYGQFNYGNKGDSPLREFKIRNGFEEVMKPRFFIPLTAWGSVCMKMKLHRGLLGILPANVITMGVNARAKWYDVKRSVISRCSSTSERPNSDRQMERSIPPAGSNS